MLQEVISGLFVSHGNTSNSKIAAFDLDWTLIRPIKGRFSKNNKDWDFLPNRISTLKTYVNDGYTIVIFSNQLSKGDKRNMLISKINNVLFSLANQDIYPWVFVSVEKDIYRKPNTGMWQVLEQYINDINKNNSFYVGDAAGRPQDFNNTDKTFAENIGITFYVPEQIFPNNKVNIPDTQTMFIFVGMPGSGKSTFYAQYLEPKGWVHANQDILKTQTKMISFITKSLIEGKSVAIDATNPLLDKRLQYIKLAVQYKIPTLIIYFVRDGHGWNKLRAKPVPEIAYNAYYKNLIEPNKEIDYVPVIQIF